MFVFTVGIAGSCKLFPALKFLTVLIFKNVINLLTCLLMPQFSALIVVIFFCRWVDGFSVFYVGENGLVYKHKMDRVSNWMIYVHFFVVKVLATFSKCLNYTSFLVYWFAFYSLLLLLLLHFFKVYVVKCLVYVC